MNNFIKLQIYAICLGSAIICNGMDNLSSDIPELSTPSQLQGSEYPDLIPIHENDDSCRVPAINDEFSSLIFSDIKEKLINCNSNLIRNDHAHS